MKIMVDVEISYQQQLAIFIKVIDWIKSQGKSIQFQFKVRVTVNEFDEEGIYILEHFLFLNKFIELEIRGYTNFKFQYPYDENYVRCLKMTGYMGLPLS